jgi:hypothetical protein
MKMSVQLLAQTTLQLGKNLPVAVEWMGPEPVWGAVERKYSIAKTL